MAFFDDGKEAFAIAALGGKVETHSVFFASIEVDHVEDFKHEVVEHYKEHGFMTGDEACEVFDEFTTRVRLPENVMLIAIQEHKTKETTYGLVDFSKMKSEADEVCFSYRKGVAYRMREEASWILSRALQRSTEAGQFCENVSYRDIQDLCTAVINGDL